MENRIYDEKTVFGMQNKATIIFQSLHYFPKKKSRLASGERDICGILKRINSLFILIY